MKAQQHNQTYRVGESTVAMFHWSRSPVLGLSEEMTLGHRAAFCVEEPQLGPFLAALGYPVLSYLPQIPCFPFCPLTRQGWAGPGRDGRMGGWLLSRMYVGVGALAGFGGTGCK